MLGLRTTIYHVADLMKAKLWYSRAFEKTPYFDEPFYVGFNIKGYELGLLPEENKNKHKGTSVVAYWGVEDIHKEFERFLDLGAFANEAPHNVGGEIIVGSVLDLWGNAIGLIYNPFFQIEQ